MGKTLQDKMAGVPASRRKRIQARAEELIAEELSLQDLRRARKLTQQRMAKLLGIGQDGVSRLEKRSDLLLSTLRDYVAAMGGRLDLVVQFADRPCVLLQDLAIMDAKISRASRTKRSRPPTGSPRGSLKPQNSRLSSGTRSR